MNKELTPLEALERLYARASVYCPIDEIGIILNELHIIKTALNEKANIENRLDDIFSKHHIKSFTELEESLGDCKIASPDDDSIKLKALEIIKEKEVNVQNFKSCLDVGWGYNLCEKNCRDNDEWEETPPYRHSMTKEEFDLLKEVFGNEIH